MIRNRFLSDDFGRRIFTMLLSAWLLIAVLIAAGLLSFFSSGQAYQDFMQRSESLQASALKLNTALITEALYVRSHLITGEESALTYRQLAHEAALYEYKYLSQSLSENPLIDPQALALLEEQHEAYDETADTMLALRAAGRSAEAVALFDARSDPLIQAVQESGQALQAAIQRGLLAEAQDAEENTRLAVFGAAALVLIIVAVTSLIIIFQILPLLRQMRRFEDAVQNSAEHSLYHPIAQEVPGAPALALVSAYNQIITNLVASSSATMKYLRQTAHEANSLLTPVLGYGAMIAQPELRWPDDDVSAFGQIIVEQAQRVTRLLEDAALAARIDAQQYTPNLAPLRLGPLLAALAQDMREETGRAVIVEDCPTGQVITADALGLERAFRKLVENAVLYSPVPAPVTVRVEPCGGPGRDEQQVMIHIIDQGAGLSLEEMQQLFQPFTRLKNEATRRVPGSGLGLYLARAIVRAHHGDIRVQPRQGGGTIFTMQLPVSGE